MLKRSLFRLARRPWMGGLLRWLFTHMNFLIPLDRLHETDTLLAFYHPRPAYPVHILIVPRRSIPDMLALETDDADFLVEVFATVRLLIERLELSAYRLITNGGDYQDVPLLHFHLISESSPAHVDMER